MTLTRSNAVLLIAVAGAFLSTVGLFVKIMTLSPIIIVGMRGLIAALVIACWMGRPRFTWSLPQLGGAIAVAAAQLFFVIATRQTTAANAVFIQYTAPLYVAIFGIWYLREKPKPLDWLAMGLILGGLLLFFGGELNLEAQWGNMNALISGVAFAAFILFLRKQQNDSTIETVFLGNIFAALIGLPFLWGATPTLTEWGSLLFLGIFQLGLPFILIATAIKKLTAVETSVIQNVEPILNPVWVFLIVGETPSGLTLLGGFLVLSAVTMRGIMSSRPDP